MNVPPVQEEALGDIVFDRLRAEYESAWLDRVFVEPPDFDGMTGMRSIVVFGESGSGKTVLRMELERSTLRPNQPPIRLVVAWRPALPPAEYEGSQLVRYCLAQAMDACALALLRFLGHWPERFRDAPEWAQEIIRWFIHQYLQGDHRLHLSRLEDEIEHHGLVLLQDVIARSPRLVLRTDAPDARVIADLVSAVLRLGMSGVWVIVDGLEPWVEAETETIGRMLKALLSTLALFEEPGFALKLMVPAEFEPYLSSSGAMVRRRMDVHWLRWPVESLVKLVECRLAAFTGSASCRLADLYASDALLVWLQQYGGSLPLGWLELVRPLAVAYVTQGMKRPLSPVEWAEIRQRHPPQLRLDLQSNQVFIGYGEVVGLQPGGYKLLRYLYEHRPRLCTRSELYYRAYLGLDHEPQTHYDIGWESPNDWGGIVDTILWRLRQVLEPDPKHPIYLISSRGKGVRLEHTW